MYFNLRRGLNPPHRVKSISMASFTPEEIEQVKNKGNQVRKRLTHVCNWESTISFQYASSTVKSLVTTDFLSFLSIAKQSGWDCMIPNVILFLTAKMSIKSKIS